jgi:hypothetical protein
MRAHIAHQIFDVNSYSLQSYPANVQHSATDCNDKPAHQVPHRTNRRSPAQLAHTRRLAKAFFIPSQDSRAAGQWC